MDARLTSLTVLAGLNSTGKSTLLQAIGALRQSYEPNGRTDGLSSSGELVQLGKFGDLLTEGTQVTQSSQDRGKRIELPMVFGGLSMPTSGSLVNSLPLHRTS